MKKIIMICLLFIITFSLTGCTIEDKIFFGEDDAQSFVDPYANKGQYVLTTYDNKDVTVAEIPTLDDYDTSGPVNAGIFSNDVDNLNLEGESGSISSTSVSNGDTKTSGSVTLTNRQRAAYNATQTEKNWLYACVMAEAGGQGKVGMTLVADVIISRALKSNVSIKDIITAKNQFETYRNGSVSKYLRNGVTSECKAACNDALAGVDYSQGALYFCSTAYYNGRSSGDWWKSSLKYLFTWKGHVFCKT